MDSAGGLAVVVGEVIAAFLWENGNGGRGCRMEEGEEVDGGGRRTRELL